MATKLILIAGPTASGKSALALALAERFGGVVINADSMQVYRELPIITAQPTAEEQARVPHRLYGHVSAAEPYSVARWLDDVRGVLDEVQAKALRPIIVGGTGLYFKALLEGLSPVPAIPADVRAHWRAVAADAAPGALHAELLARDRVMAARLDPSDTQRLTRALEVIDATGRSLADWQREAGVRVVDAETAVKLVVERAREDLASRIDVRFDRMIASGALDEAAQLRAMQLPPDRPALRAHGVPRLIAHLGGEMTLAAAIAAAKLETRQYVKRQQTWAAKLMIAWKRLDATQMERKPVDIASFIDC
jgi:tRNA dimethylallyltransferase